MILRRGAGRRQGPSGKVLLAAVLTGIIAALGILSGSETPSRGEILEAVGIGLGAVIATILLEEVVRAAVSWQFPPKNANAGKRPQVVKRGNGAGAQKPKLRRILVRSLRRLREMRWLRLAVRPEIAPLPDEKTIFSQRPKAVEALYEIHARQRRERPSLWFSRLSRRRREQIAGSSPVFVLIHGKAGTGKSEVGLALAQRLVDKYPNGVIYINVGTAGGVKPAAEILKTCLDALKWPERDMPQATADRLKVMRSLTAHRRILFFFDAVRHRSQLQQILPIGSGCAVIVTSRRDLGVGMPGMDSYLLEEPDTDESLDILLAAAQLPEETRSLAAAEIVRLCGHLPLALRSAGERVKSGADLGDVADLLRCESTRLEFLDTENRKVKDRITSEYHRLLPKEQLALQWLTLVPSRSFEAHALQVLLGVGSEEAENTLAQLAEARVLDVVAPPPGSQAIRYRFDPLVKLFAQQELRATAQERQKALGRWDTSLLDRLEEQLGEAPRTPENGSTITLLNLPRADHPSVLRAMQHAFTNKKWSSCWKIACGAGPSIDDVAGLQHVMAVLDLGLAAAKEDGDPLGAADVLLAQATLLIEVERYSDGFVLLEQVTRQAKEMLATPGADEKAWQLRHGVAHRKRAEAYLQAAAYHRVDGELQEASRWAAEAGVVKEQRLLELLRAELHHVASPQLSPEELHDDATLYRYQLALSERERRLGHWQIAAVTLLSELRHSDGDLRRTASINYRLARLRLNEWTAQAPIYGTEDENTAAQDVKGGNGLIREAIRRATETLLIFGKIGDSAGKIRARCLLARALTAGRLYVEAQLECDQAASEVMGLGDRLDFAHPPLRARILRARGELDLRRGDTSRGFNELLAASRLFAQTRDWSSQAEVNRLLKAHEQGNTASWGSLPDALYAMGSDAESPRWPGQDRPGPRRVPAQRTNEVNG